MKPKYILPTRFNNDTWMENEAHRTKIQGIRCIYGSPHPIASKIVPREPVCVIEMNNTQNRIMGVGLIRNEPHPRCEHIPYSTGNYNRFVFTGRYRLDRCDLSQDLLDILDYILFKEKTHLKRGAGFTTVPDKLLFHRTCEGRDIIREITARFVEKYKNANVAADVLLTQQHT